MMGFTDSIVRITFKWYAHVTRERGQGARLDGRGSLLRHPAVSISSGSGGAGAGASSYLLPCPSLPGQVERVLPQDEAKRKETENAKACKA